AVRRGLDRLREAGVEFNVLTVVQGDNGDHPVAVYEGLKELGAEFIQFIPIVEREGETGVSERSVAPEQFGTFLSRIFDLWLAGDIDRIFVQHFNSALNAVLGNPYTLCVHAPRCGRAVALEHNGDLFSCDHYVFEEFRLGNIGSESYRVVLDGEQQVAFGDAKELALPRECLDCEVRRFCHGGCPAHRFVPDPGGGFAGNYLCTGYRAFFGHVEPFLEAMASAIQRKLPPSQYFRFLTDPGLGPGRNAPCPCGSGRRFRLCCGQAGG
ncbi:MAG: SPASM domain-containing protein, partial [Dehalococcoidia bacterium]